MNKLKENIYDSIFIVCWLTCIWWATYRWQLFFTGLLALFLSACAYSARKKRKET